MDGSLESLFNFYIFPTGRRLFAIGQVREAAKAQSFTELSDLCDTAITHDQATLDIERRWAGEEKSGGTNPLAQRIDALVDRALAAVRDHAMAQTEGAPPEDPIHADVAAFVKRIFPAGVYAVTSKPYVEELAAVDDITGLLQGEQAKAVADLGIGRIAARLADLAEQYRAALKAPGATLTWGQVRAARSDGQGLLLEAVAVILGKFHDRTAAGTDARMALLAPILKQNQAIGEYIRARRAIDDVDPATGTDSPGTPAGPAGPTGATGAGGATGGAGHP